MNKYVGVAGKLIYVRLAFTSPKNFIFGNSEVKIFLNENTQSLVLEAFYRNCDGDMIVLIQVL